MNFPFVEKTISGDVCIREFDDHIKEHELEWHLDREDRLVEVVENNGNWQVQLDNKLPVSLNQSIFIPRETYHRVIKGNGRLIVKITKFKQ